MKLNGFQIVSECMDMDDVKKRPISNLDSGVQKEAEKTSKEYTAGEGKELNVKKDTPSLDKGKALGDEKGTVEKELKKIKK